MSKPLQQFVCVCMAFLLSELPAHARLVSLDFEEPLNVDPATAKSYAAHIREQIENKWQDVYISGVFDIPKVQVDIKITDDGFVKVERNSVFDPTDKFDADDTFRDFLKALVHQFPPPPDQQPHVVTVTAKCRTAGRERPNFKNLILALAALAAVGAAGYGLYRLSRSSNSSGNGPGGYANPDVVWVSGYTNHYGHWVPGHWRTRANGTMFDNFSSLGNFNPYTGEVGTVVPRY